MKCFRTKALRAFCISGVLALSHLVQAAPPPSVPLAPQVVQSHLSTADDAFAQMFVSHAYVSQRPKSQVQSGLEMHRYHVGELAALIRGVNPLVAPLAPGARLKKVFAYYGLGSKELIDAILDAKKNGIEIEITTDLNRSLQGDFTKSSVSTDFNQARIHDSETGLGLARLIQGGFEIADGKHHGSSNPYRILSQPLFDEKIIQMIPIFHLKESFTVRTDADGNEVPLYMTLGTANMNEAVPRYNRMFVLRDPDLVRYAYGHYKNMAATFEKGGSIKDVPPAPPIEVRYRDGTSLRLGYTDGRFNLHTWHIDRLNAAIAHPDQTRVLHHLMSNFVVTHGEFLSTLEQALETFPEMNLSGVVDQKFLNDRSWGLSRAMQGIPSYRPMGKPVSGFSFAARMRPVSAPDGTKKWEDRIALKGWVRAASGKPVMDLDGAPSAIEVWHDKTRVTRVEEIALNGQKETRFWLSTGSFNESKNTQNMESLLFGDFKANSWVIGAIEESVLAVAQRYPESAIPGADVYVLDDLGRFLGVGYYSLKHEQAQDLMLMLREGRFPEARGYLLALGRNRTDLTEKLYFESLRSRVDRLMAFLEWLRSKTTPKAYLNRVHYRYLPSLLRLLSDPGISADSARHILGRILWNLEESTTTTPEVRRIQANREIVEAWKILGLEREPTRYKKPIPNRPAAGLKTLRIQITQKNGVLLARAIGENSPLEKSLLSFDLLQGTQDQAEQWIESLLLQLAKFASAHPERGKPRVTLIEEDRPVMFSLLRAIATQIREIQPSPFQNLNVFVRRKLPDGSTTAYKVLRSGDVVYTEATMQPEDALPPSEQSLLKVTPAEVARGAAFTASPEEQKSGLIDACVEMLLAE